MAIESRRWKGLFAPSEIVQLKQICLTPGQIFPPGKYIAGELPDIAFEMGLVEALPPVKGKNDQIEPPPETTEE